MDSLYKPGSRYETDTNQTITIIEKIDGGRGGEGEVWKTNIPGHLVKIFHDKLRTPELHRKLEILVKQSPQIDSPYNNHIPCAWPKNIIFESGKMVGCLIPLVKQPLSLVDIYSVKSRTKTKAISFSFKQALLLCIELSRIMDYLHQNEYVIGDMKPQNILVNSFFLPTIIDIDSIQVRDKFTRKFHRCVVGSDEFQPPELNNCTPKDVDQKPFHDHFRLAVIIHMILLGYHPFNGTLPDDPERKTQQNINEGIWFNSPPSRGLLMQRPHDIPISKLHKSIEKGFLKCFNYGHDDPTQRPSAKDWVDYLSLAIRDLNECFNVDNHYFASRNVSCFLCSRDIDNYPDLNLLHRLAIFLKNSDWRSADAESYHLLLKASKRAQYGWLDDASIKETINFNFLKAIDELWVKYSNNTFGFSIQSQIYSDTGNTPSNYDNICYRKFAQEVGWINKSLWKNYNALDFSLSAPKGHLPFLPSLFSCPISHISLRFKNQK